MNKILASSVVVLCLATVCFGGWTTIAPLLSRRSDMACTLSGSSIYLTGGCASDQTYEANFSACDQISSRTDIYFPESDTWATASNMPRQRHRHITLAYNDSIYVFGGRDTDDHVITAIDVYSTASRSWTTLSVSLEASVSDFAGYVVGSKAVMFGGYLEDYQYTNATHLFDFATNTFEYNVAQMKHGRGDICSVVLEGKGYAFGGFSSDFCKPMDALEMFDLEKRTWANAPVFTDATNGGDGACAIFNGRFLTVGGEIKTVEPVCLSDCLTTVESYDPVTDKWAKETAMTLPDPRFRFCGVHYDNRVFIFGGQGPLEEKAGLYTHALLATAQVYQESAAPLLAPALPLALLITLLSLSLLA